MAAAALIELRALGCVRDERPLFNALDFRLSAGELVELRGPNGAGKSTLLRCIAGLYPDYDGTLAVAPALYLGHKLALAAHLSAAENLRWYAGLDGRSADSAGRVHEALLRVGLPGYDAVLCGNLSAGQQRRVALARLLVCERPLWLLDEPLTALDAAGAELLRDVLRDHLGAGGGALCATHATLEIAGHRRLDLGSATTQG